MIRRFQPWLNPIVFSRNYVSKSDAKWTPKQPKTNQTKDSRSSYLQSYKKVKTGLTMPLERYIEKHMDVIDSYNNKHKIGLSDRINVNLEKEISWSEVIKNDLFRSATFRFLRDASNNITSKFHSKKYNKNEERIEMTDFQKRFYTLMTAYASTIAKGPHGSGRTFALITSALNLRRAHSRGSGINSLILVKSNEMVLQYQRIIKSIMNRIDNTKMDNRKVAQFLFRGSPDEESQQEDDLADVPCPHMLVSTPQRLLDLLSSRGMDYLKINSLAYIGVDDFSSMLDPEYFLETKRKAPAVLLLDYVLKLQDYRRSHNDPHPQVVLIVDDSTSDILVEQVKQYTQWIDWNKFATVGKFKEHTDIPSMKYVPSDITISTTMVNPVEKAHLKEEDEARIENLCLKLSEAKKLLEAEDLKKNTKKKLQRKIPMLQSRIDMESFYDIELRNMAPFYYSSDPNNWIDLLHRSYNGNNQVYFKHRNKRKSKLNMKMKTGELELIVDGLKGLLKEKNCLQWTSNKRILVVHEDETSSKTVAEYLNFTFQEEDLACFTLEKDWDAFTKPKESGEPWIYITNISSVNGVTLPGLDSIFVLGIDTLKSTNSLCTLLTRMRPKNGLISKDRYPIFSKKRNETIVDEDIKGRMFIVTSKPDFGDLERNFLERSFVVNGLIEQRPAVEHDETWSKNDKEKYEVAMGIGNSNNDGFVVLNGLTGEQEANLTKKDINTCT